MNYPPNTQRWRKDDLVLHDADAKEPKMLMRVIGYTRDDDLCKTQYVFPYHKRTIYKNDLKYLHDPTDWFYGADKWWHLSTNVLEKYQDNWERVRDWNRRYFPGKAVRITSADGGFVTTTGGLAVFEDGSSRIYLEGCSEHRGGWWSLEFVEAITNE